jgi:SAM-dependent MidA family methyltransferase
LTGVDVAPAPPGDVTWLPALPEVHGLLVANEWLDTVPLDVVEDGRLVLVDDSGQEALGAPLASAWAADWWPDARRVEIGASRDLAWATAVSRVRRGLAVAVDYGHTRAERRPTLTGYRDGRQVPPVPDGSCDITAHVALDAVAAATGSLLVRQRDALQALGLSAAVPGPAEPAFGERLARASQARELLDPDGLGAFGWLLRPVDVAIGWMGV